MSSGGGGGVGGNDGGRSGQYCEQNAEQTKSNATYAPHIYTTFALILYSLHIK